MQEMEYRNYNRKY